MFEAITIDVAMDIPDRVLCGPHVHISIGFIPKSEIATGS